ncbi:MAG: hypothetical protein KW802_02925 [Candidatus Doudnabacteria bacterium]|nr:hypothetical protein [Candidatus Doudnabacteria bacterium]
MENNTGLLSASELLKKALDFTRSKAGVLYGIALLSAVIWVPFIILGVFAGATTYQHTGNLAGVWLLIVPLVIIALGLSIWSQIALIKAVVNETGFSDSFKAARSSFWRYIWTSFLLGLILFLGFVLLVVPGIIFAVWYAFAGMIVIVEGISGMDAIRQSKTYVKGRWGKVAWRIAVPTLWLFLIQFLLGLLFNKDTEFGNILSGVISFASVPVITTYQYLLYKNLKESMGMSVPVPVVPTLPNETPSQSV